MMKTFGKYFNIRFENEVTFLLLLNCANHLGGDH